MPSKIRFHLDENVSNTIADDLCRRGIDVTRETVLSITSTEFSRPELPLSHAFGASSGN